MSDQKFFSAKELIVLSPPPLLPKSKKGIIDKAKRENWQSRPRQGRGGGLEYALTSLPPAVQKAIHLKLAREKQASEVARPQGEHQERYLSEALWQPFDKACDVQKAKAQAKFNAVDAVYNLVMAGSPLMEAFQTVAEAQGLKQGSVKNWYYKVQGFHRGDWLAVLLKRTGANKGKEAQMDADAWEAFKSDYLRPERPSISACYERLERVASEMNWVIPTLRTITRKVGKDIPFEVKTLLREGEHALAKLVPTLSRSVESIEAMEWINGDGYQHNVFVKFKIGDKEEIHRPKTWFWQDVRTRKILGYRVDISENTDTIRLSLMDVVHKYGVPRHLTIDNTRAAANKWMTGRVKNRYRFKVKEDDPMGIIPQLGIELHWTSVVAGKGWGQAKPVERVFGVGGLGELVDKDPALAGFYTGETIYNKPDNYNARKDGVPFEVFLEVLHRGVEIFNQKSGRRTELCAGIYSFEQIFQRDYLKATVRKATKEQLRILMLTAENVTIKKNGEFELMAGGEIAGRKNKYWAEALMGYAKSKVTVRFDPNELHSLVYVYSLDGKFLTTAECREAVAFGDTQAARTQKRLRTRIVKQAKEQAKNMELLDAIELAGLQPKAEAEETPSPTMIEMVISEQNALKKVIVEANDDEDESLFEKYFKKGLDLTYNK